MSAAESLDRLDENARTRFVERAVTEMSYVPPVVASYPLDSLDVASGGALTPNGRPDQLPE